MKNLQLKNSLLLLLTATIWGSAFVAQRVGMNYIEPFTFNATRSFIGGIVLLPVIFYQKNKKQQEIIKEEQNSKNILIIGGIACGIILCASSAFQQIGVKYTSSVGKAGFITACYIVIVPMIQLLLHSLSKQFPKALKEYTNKKVGGIKILFAIILALVGLYLLCINENMIIDKADLLVLACAFCFSFHILVVDFFSPKVDGVKLSCIQFFVCGISSMIMAFIYETPNMASIIQGWLPILYAGALSSGVGYTLQIIGQKDFNPAIASLILSLESCISVIASWLFLGQVMSVKEILGCVIMFVAIILAQLPESKKREIDIILEKD